MNAFVLGVTLGLSITISFGPGFFALFQTSLVRGVYAGMIFAIGMWLSDLTLVGVSYFGLASLFLSVDPRVMGAIAGTILIGMGLHSLLFPPAMDWQKVMVAGPYKKPHVILAKGYILNITNPLSLIFWIGLVGFATNNWGLKHISVMHFFLGVFLTAFSTDLMKCYLSGLLRRFLATHSLGIVNKVMGVILLGIGVYFIYNGFRQH